MNPLALVPSADLIAEICTRYKIGIFYAIQDRTIEKGKPVNLEFYRFWGNERICQGLCADLICQINKGFDIVEVPDSEL